MPVPTIDQFKALVRKSGAVAPEHLDRALSGFTPADNEKDPTRALVRYLIARKLLTPWQSEQLLRGKSTLCIGPYRLLGRLGAGGMSTVYAAEHTVMRRQVAIKVLPKDHTSRPQALDRFLREAQIISSCNHPNVVQAYDVDHVGGVFFIVLERVEGRDLEKAVLVDGPLSADRAADYIRQTAEGLAHVHSLGVVHRDLKPSNLLLDLTGTVKLLDLGVALLTLDDGSGGARTTKQTTLGTTEYMAPEQAMDSHAVDARADLYSLGCTLYFLLTGAPPFPARTMAEALLKHLKHAAKSISLCREEMGLSEVPDDLVAICDRLMAKKPADRFQTAEAVAAELSSWQARRSASISETWNNVSSETPTTAWSAASGEIASVSPPSLLETDETVETAVPPEHIQSSPSAVPPVVGEASSEVAGSTVCDDDPSRASFSRSGSGASSAARRTAEARDANQPESDEQNADEPPIVADETAEESPGEQQPSAEAATAEIPVGSWAVAEGYRGPSAEQQAKDSARGIGVWVYAAVGLVALGLLSVGGLWAAGWLPAAPATAQGDDERAGRRPRRTSEPDSASEESTSGPAALVAGTAPVVHTTPGRVGRALIADGANPLVYESQPGFDPPKLTLECWLRVQQTPAADQTAWLVGKNGDDRAPGHYSIVLQGDKPAAIVNASGSGEPIKLAADSSIGPGTWRHLALTDDGRTAKFYLDGRLAASAPLAQPRQGGAGHFAIGGRPDRGVPPTSGVQLDEVRLYRRSLTADEIKFHAERPDWAASQSKTVGLVEAWNFDPVRLDNPSFESDGHGWNVHSGAKTERDRKKAHQGERYVRLPSGRNGAELTVNRLKPGATYTFIAWARVGEPTTQVMLGVKDYGGKEVKLPISSVEWAAAAIPFKVGADGSAKMFAWKEKGGDALFDDVTLLAGVPDPASLNPSLKSAVGPALDAIALASTPVVDPSLQIDPARLGVRVVCGRPDAPENVARDGYRVERSSGGEWSKWPSDAARTHCWTEPSVLSFAVVTPPQKAGVLRLVFCDGDRKGRRERIAVAGRDVGEVSDFVSPKQLTVAISPDMTADGRLDVTCFATGNGEAVVSDVEFYPAP
ncbi:MAG TPA: protein kinase [Pirellulales bacterium]